MKPFSETLSWIFSHNWCIGLYEGESPNQLKPIGNEPIIDADDISDCLADFVADPFLIKHENKYYVFFEILDVLQDKGKIGVASSKNGTQWNYDGLVLEENYHLSYPFVFSWKNKIFMLPDNRDESIRLYKTTNFPFEWSLELVLKQGEPFADTTLHRHNNLWWMFTSFDKKLWLYYSEELFSKQWQSHPQNPIRSGSNARMAGNLVETPDNLFIFSQQNRPSPNSRIIGYTIETLNTKEYKENPMTPDQVPRPNDVLWNRQQVHHVSCIQENPKHFLATVDGKSKRFDKRIHVSFLSFLNILRRKFW